MVPNMEIEKTKAELIEVKKAGAVRRKLWNLSTGLHCSIIGTCFRRSELSRLAKKKALGLDYCTGDFKVHSALVSAAGIKGEKSKLLHRLLDKKFRVFVTRYTKIDNDEELEKMWLEDLGKGAVPGAYWALLTHPCAGKDLLQKVYGEVHMMGHDFFTQYQQDKETQLHLRSKLDLLKEVLESERENYRNAEERLQNEIAELRVSLEEKSALTAENESLYGQLSELKKGIFEDDLGKKNEEMKREVDQLRTHNDESARSLETLKKHLQKNRELLESAKRSASELEEKNKLLKKEKHDLKIELLSLEAALLSKISTSGKCSACADCNTDNCPGPDLCGKTVLYVGGQHKMIPHYRQMIEKLGARFMHHDGGKEASKAILPKLLNNADAVLCPVDCVSHYACNCVKRICKRNQKPFVMMRSSGLSSLARGLNEIVQ